MRFKTATILPLNWIKLSEVVIFKNKFDTLSNWATLYKDQPHKFFKITYSPRIFTPNYIHILLNGYFCHIHFATLSQTNPNNNLWVPLFRHHFRIQKSNHTKVENWWFGEPVVFWTNYLNYLQILPWVTMHFREKSIWMRPFWGEHEVFLHRQRKREW